MIAKSPEERRYYEARLKMQRDEQARLEAARDQGLAEGEARGEAIGRARMLQQLAGLPESSVDALRQHTLEELAAMRSGFWYLTPFPVRQSDDGRGTSLTPFHEQLACFSSDEMKRI